MKQVLGQFPNGHFPDGQCSEDISPTYSSPTDSSPKDISPNGQFSEQTFPRTNISPKQIFLFT